MAEYIEFEATKQAIDRIRSVYHMARDFNAVSVIDKIFGEIKEIPAADVAPVVHGHWAEKKPSGSGGIWDYYFVCSVCGGNTPNKAYVIAPDFCPNCGAKMDEEG